LEQGYEGRKREKEQLAAVHSSETGRDVLVRNEGGRLGKGRNEKEKEWIYSEEEKGEKGTGSRNATNIWGASGTRTSYTRHQ